jgi:polyhydroxyalkanoate synthase
VLSSGGHIAGIVNPPGPKAWHEAGDYDAAGAQAWRSKATKENGSWWEDWTTWSDERAGALVKPPSMGSRKHKALADAPGEYVFG